MDRLRHITDVNSQTYPYMIDQKNPDPEGYRRVTFFVQKLDLPYWQIAGTVICS